MNLNLDVQSRPNVVTSWSVDSSATTTESHRSLDVTEGEKPMMNQETLSGNSCSDLTYGYFVLWPARGNVNSEVAR